LVRRPLPNRGGPAQATLGLGGTGLLPLGGRRNIPSPDPAGHGAAGDSQQKGEGNPGSGVHAFRQPRMGSERKSPGARLRGFSPETTEGSALPGLGLLFVGSKGPKSEGTHQGKRQDLLHRTLRIRGTRSPASTLNLPDGFPSRENHPYLEKKFFMTMTAMAGLLARRRLR